MVALAQKPYVGVSIPESPPLSEVVKNCIFHLIAKVAWGPCSDWCIVPHQAAASNIFIGPIPYYMLHAMTIHAMVLSVNPQIWWLATLWVHCVS